MTRTNLFGAIRVTAIMAAVGLLGLTTQAQSTRTWDAAANANWNDDGNWDTTKPAGGDSVIFGATGKGTVNTMDIPDLSLATFTVTAEGSAAVTNIVAHTTDLDGKTLTVNSLILNGIGPGSSGIFHVANGTLQVNTLFRNVAGNDSDVYTSLANDAMLKVGQNASSRGEIILGGDASDRHITYLTAGTSLGDLYLTNLKIGSQSGSVGGFAELNLSAVTTPAVIDVSTALEVALGQGGSGRLILSDAVDLKVGSLSTRASRLNVGDNLRSGYAWLPPGQSEVQELVTGTGRFEVYVTNLLMSTSRRGQGKIDATSATVGIVDVSKTLRLTGHDGVTAPISGQLLLGDAISVKVGSESSRGDILVGNAPGTLTMGTNTFAAYLNTCAVTRIYLNLGSVSSGILDISGKLDHPSAGQATITLSDGFVTKFGDPTSRLPFDFMVGRIGSQDAQCNLKAGGTFHAWLANTRIGVDTLTGAFTRNQYATLDFSSATNFIFDVDGDLTMAGPGQDQRVKIIMPHGNAKVTGDLTIGGTGVGSSPIATYCYGHLIMTGTHFRVGGTVTLNGAAAYADSKAKVLTTLTGTSGGLDLGSSADLTVNHGLIDITFAEPSTDTSQIYWGLRWEGNKVTELEDLETAGKLTYDGAASAGAHIFASGGYTYVGIPRPPAR